MQELKTFASHYQAVAPSKFYQVTGRRLVFGSNTPDRIRDRWESPGHLVHFIESREGRKIQLDAAASAENSKGIEFITEAQNALSLRWTDCHDFVFVNPPYSDIPPWVEKCIFEARQRKRAVIYLILPVDVSTAWFSRAVINATEVIFVISDGKRAGRVGFIDPDTGTATKRNNRGTAIVKFTGKARPTVTKYISQAAMETEYEKHKERGLGSGAIGRVE